MTSWVSPRALATVDTVTSATPLGFIKARLAEGESGISGPVDLLSQSGYSESPFAESASEFISNRLGITIAPIYVDGFFGNIPGCIGEVSAFLLLLGAVYLFAKKIITWHIPVAYLGAFGLLVLALGGNRYGAGGFQGDLLFQLVSGGLVLGVFYMATDMVTSPLRPGGMLIYGAGAGLLTFLIRYFGSFPEGVSLAIILMNVFVPLINRFARSRIFGTENEAEDS
jgi:electron transport complex protein RnfD